MLKGRTQEKGVEEGKEHRCFKLTLGRVCRGLIRNIMGLCLKMKLGRWLSRESAY